MRRALVRLTLPWILLTNPGAAEPVARFPELPTAPSAPAPAPAAPKEAHPPPPRPAPSESVERPTPRRPVMRTGAEELADRGRRLEEAQRFTEAIRAYSESINLDPGRGETLVALAKLRMRLGDVGEAELLLTTAARNPKVAAEALTLRAHLRSGQGRASEAARDLESAANLAPDDAARTEELSAIYVARGAWPSALSLWRRAAAQSREEERDRRTKLQVRALTVLAAELDPVTAGAGRGYSWARRAMAKIAAK
jgi:tetratricopeptide (TPR) repeat protein